MEMIPEKMELNLRGCCCCYCFLLRRNDDAVEAGADAWEHMPPQNDGDAASCADDSGLDVAAAGTDDVGAAAGVAVVDRPLRPPSWELRLRTLKRSSR